MKFTYRWGQRPLEGYTLKRGLGQGGFGEVYFAVSDGGKEVALKLIRGHSEIELRGIANCLNFKHPNLVHLYDLRVDGLGDRWLVMEYVQGEPLSTILQRNTRGLPEVQARELFLQAARAVAFLHDHAVVHRDIKPANLFVENGVAKLGDYGLSKSVGASQHSQSSNVGTIHYMAPEVASGAYSKQIDIYACGVMLYEMLTGEVPFKGESWAEIAIKHQTDLPDMSKAPAAYIPVLEMALNKKADRRFPDMPAMIEAVEAIGRPIERTVEPLPLQRKRPADTTPARELPPILAELAPAETWRRKAGELSSAFFYTPFVALPVTSIWALFTGKVEWGTLGALFLTMVAVSWSVLLAAKIWEGRKTSQPRRLTLGLLGAGVGCVAFWLAGWSFPELWSKDEPLPPGLDSYWGNVLRGEHSSLEILAGFMLFFALALMVPRWWLTAEPKRFERFTIYPLLANGIWALILLGIFKAQLETHFDERHIQPPNYNYVVLALAGAAAVVQLVSPYSPPRPVKLRRRRRLEEADSVR